ncbi:CAP domain-containing protein [Candidatus Electronema sp. PJ]|uniref:CAP domain-containing protein n=1 Tax=Candidatus Electronema sp. PJ TaxID=3401572 RepID=UPI003AA806F3
MIITKILSILPLVFFTLTACAQTQAISEDSVTDQPEGSGIVLINKYYEETDTFAEGVGTVDSTAMLSAHNRWRAEVGVPDLVWSESLAQAAQIWAEHLSNNGCCAMYHSGGGYGENIYKVSAVVWSNGRREIQTRTPLQIVDGWASEAKNYDYENNTCNGICGHYTQIIWRDSTELGCAVAICPDKAQMWVCNYAPVGNIEGQRPY